MANEGYPAGGGSSLSASAILARLIGATTLAAGALLYGAGTSTLSTLAIGASGTFLKSNGSAPAWANIAASDITSGTLAVARGGTGLASYAIGDLLYADGATSLAKLAGVATGNALISGGVTTAPSWGKIGLTTHVSGTLPAANGGTGVSNTGTLTNASNTTITGGGTLALAGFTLTVPATGTVGLLGVSGTWTATQTFSSANISLTGTSVYQHNRTAAGSYFAFLWSGSTRYEAEVDSSGNGAFNVRNSSGSAYGNFAYNAISLNPAGTVTIGTAATLVLAQTTNTTLTVSSTQTSSSLVTGCAVFAGGVGISGALNVSSIQSSGGIVAGTVLQATTSLQVGTTMRLGGSPLAYQAIVSTQSLSGSSTHFGLNMAPTYGSDATAEIRGVVSNVTTAAASFTNALARAFYVNSPTIGAGSAITDFTGYYCAALSGPGTSYAFRSAGAGLVNFGDTTDASSLTVAALVGAGGAAFSKSVYARNFVSVGGTITTSQPVFDGTQTWNSGATTFTAISLNVTNTASGANSNLMNLQVGSVPILQIQPTQGASVRAINTATASAVETLSINLRSTGTAAAGFGPRIRLAAYDDGGNEQVLTYIDTVWATATSASRKGRMTFNVYDTASRECLRLEASGSAAMIGFLGATAIVRPSSTGETGGFTAGAGTAMNSASTSTGNTGSTAYTFGDVVKHLKNLGLLTS